MAFSQTFIWDYNLSHRRNIIQVSIMVLNIVLCVCVCLTRNINFLLKILAKFNRFCGFFPSKRTKKVPKQFISRENRHSRSFLCTSSITRKSLLTSLSFEGPIKSSPCKTFLDKNLVKLQRRSKDQCLHCYPCIICTIGDKQLKSNYSALQS